MSSFYILAFLAAMTVGILNGVVGNFLILRRQSLFGDVLGHAIFPGVLIGYMVAGMEKNLSLIILCSFLVSILAVASLEFFRGFGVKEDSSMAIILSGFYGIGGLILSYITSTDSSQHAGVKAFLFGQMASVTWADLKVQALVLAFVVVVLIPFYRLIRLYCFDPLYFRLLGYSELMMKVLLGTMIALSLICSIQSTGIVLVSALLVIPSSCATYWSKNLLSRIFISSFVACVGAILGSWWSLRISHVPSGASIVLCLAGLFFLSFLFSPRMGLWQELMRRRYRRKKIRLEHFIKAIYHLMELGNQASITLVEVKKRLHKAEAQEVLETIKILEEKNWILFDSQTQELRLTSQGLPKALQIVRNHRLWELYLVHKMDFKLDHVHENAEEIEHWLSEDIVKKLEEKLSSPIFDPHGRPIPSLRDMEREGLRYE